MTASGIEWVVNKIEPVLKGEIKPRYKINPQTLRREEGNF